jgi:hypothetical protein
MTRIQRIFTNLTLPGFKIHYSIFNIFRSFILLLVLACTNSAFSQKAYPKDYFRSPLEMRLLLAGTFGEIRSNHFHSGIDIKTAGVEGAPVYAVADGYVSRIKVSAYGFGKAIYVTHPNGYVSVYGHLSKYSRVIGDYIRKEQYRREQFEIELFPGPTEFPVKKGDIIAYSGNSGSSGGPHLHFEIRDGASEKPINPLLFGYEVKDLFKPRILSVKIYPEGDNSRLNGSGKAFRYLVEGWGTEHRITNNPVIKVSGDISFAIQAYDQQNDTDNKNGPYAIKLYIDSAMVFDFDVESFSFDETRYVNSYIDYEEFIKNDVRLQRTKIDPGNKLSLYEYVKNRGIYRFDDTLTHVIRYEVSDVAGNTATLSFKVRSEKAVNLGLQSSRVPEFQSSEFPVSNFYFDRPNHFRNGSVTIDAPAGVFYDSFIFTIDSAKQIPGTFSPVYKIHTKYTPIHNNITLSIKPLNMPDDLLAKALIVKIKEDGKSYASVGGNWESGYITTQIKEFGDYSIAIDTIPPKIKAVNPELFGKIAGQKTIRLTISDDLSGIASYRAILNGKWILMEYDPKNNLLVYTIDEMMIPGKNTLLVEVRDGKNNRFYYSAMINL